MSKIRTFRDGDGVTYRMEFATDAEAAAYVAPADRVLVADIPEPPPKSPTEMDQDALNEVLAAPGSLTRALALVLFAEINKLRVKGGDKAYTLTQFKAALFDHMR